DLTILVGTDWRASGESKWPEEAPLRGLANLLPAQALQELAAMADQVGNWRLGRVAVGVQGDGEGPPRVDIPWAGGGNMKRLFAYLEKQMPGGKISEEKGPKGEAMTLLTDEQRGEAMAAFGDTEILMAVSPSGAVKGRELLAPALQVKSGNKPSAAGALKE